MVWLYLIGYLLACGIGWLVSFVLEYVHNHKELKHQYEALQKKHNKLIVEHNALQEEHTEDIIADYSIMATLLEEHTTQFADIHAYLDELSGRVDQLGNIHIRIAPMQMPPEYEYAGGPSETEESYDPYSEIELPDCMKDVIKAMEEIDEL